MTARGAPRAPSSDMPRAAEGLPQDDEPDGFPPTVVIDDEHEDGSARTRRREAQASIPLWVRIGLGIALAGLVLYAALRAVRHTVR